MSDGVEGLLRDLIDLDVAQLLSPLRADLSPNALNISRGISTEPLVAWQLANRIEFGETADAVRSVRGRPGYQTRAAAFSRRNSQRSAGLEEFRRGLAELSGRQLERWGWAMEQYIREVNSFAASESARQRNVKLRRDANAAIMRARNSDLGTIERELDERNLLLQNTSDPGTAGKILLKIRDVGTTVEIAINERKQLIAKRDDLLQQVRQEFAESVETREIVQLISLSEQIRAYQRLLKRPAADRADIERNAVLRAKWEELSAIRGNDELSHEHDWLRRLVRVPAPPK